MIYCDFGVLNYQNQTTLIQKIYQALKPEGKLIIDVFTPEQYKDFNEARTITYENGGYWSIEEYLNIFSTYKYDNTYLEQYVIVTGDSLKCYNLWNHAYSDEELVDFFKQFNFTNIELFDDVTGKSRTDNSKTRCLVLTK